MENEVLRVLTETAARAKTNARRLDIMERRQDNLEALTRSVAVMQSKQEQIETDVTEIKTDVKALREKPVRWWETAIVALIGAAAGFLAKALWGIG